MAINKKKKFELTFTQKKLFWWTSRICVLLAGLAGVASVWGFMPPVGIQVSGAVAAVAGVFGRWCTNHLPAGWAPADEQPEAETPKDG